MSLQNSNKPRVGIPWRTSDEEKSINREKLENYFDAVRLAGGEPEDISLGLSSEELKQKIEKLDGFVLPGSPADVDPSRYGASRHQKTTKLDGARDQTDTAILDHAMAKHKPVLAVCYGCQILNVHQGGTLIQDIPTERKNRPNPKPHGTTDLTAGATKGDQSHDVSFVSESRLAKLAGATKVLTNSSHHQAIDNVGDSLVATARSEDDIIEAVEFQSEHDWIVGVQWHPERMPDDAFAQKIFGDFVAAVERNRAAIAPKS
ncbi:MAG TPA: gamma-glutamyl-gamma-aminobutyrate hydrolase family protein [Candidatus Dormibacteraeota bacterium]|jgi:putative glutamine amidotransferase|nr:gamma-glutamyl-gamma-aminobutyrate hydrolase family protein [Candidatus Dormibacteraeota bacterium]